MLFAITGFTIGILFATAIYKKVLVQSLKVLFCLTMTAMVCFSFYVALCVYIHGI